MLGHSALTYFALVTEAPSRIWIIDSGASYHMYNGSKSDYSVYSQLLTPIDIMIGDNTTIRATHYGSILVQNLKIDALHTPTLRYSLLSISELNDEGNITIFANDKCIIRDYTTVLITGTKNGKLFEVDSHDAITGHALLSNVRRKPNISLDESKRWHQRLAHIHLAALKSLIDGYTHDGKLCEVCVLVKHKRKIIRIPVQRTTTPFELLHIRKKKSPFQRRPALDALRALGKILDSNLALIGSWHASNSQHVASPSKRCARRGIYYPRRIPYSFPLQGSPEVELSCPRSASVQTLCQAVHQLPVQNT